ncbi:hypothetical protein [Dyadobacter pollutisoli]|uniref:Uncharacterized protein n=1 Tax=Dyadobacter pollutisoli TaxID=2910158 RepID=A0A9E8N9K2_9BACT|nr:hypothetical protein [Dyadobacter pollutisoli]WAC12395.1 hypothetical protein ON006_00240 [Dyadobacter pollutisoli]
MNDLLIHNCAAKDLRFGSYPRIDTDGNYLFDIGQKEILNQPQYMGELPKIDQKSQELSLRKATLKKEMLLYGTVTDSLEKEAKDEAEVGNIKVTDEEESLIDQETQLEELEKDMRLRGLLPNENPAIIQEQKPTTNKQNDKWQILGSFLAKWAITEGVMLIIQWSALRETKGYIDLAVRSFYFGIVILLIEYVSFLNKKTPKTYYKLYLSLTLFILVVMIALPPILNIVYPANVPAADIANQWSIAGATGATKILPRAEHPVWVEFYRSNEYLQAILCVILFIGMQIFTVDTKPAEQPVVQTDPLPEPPEKTFHDQRLQLKGQIKDTDQRIDLLKKMQTETLAKITNTLQGYLKDLSKLKEDILLIDSQTAALKIERETKFKFIEKELQTYQTDFEYLRNSDIIKQHSMTTPPWPTVKDICKHYNIQPL